MKAVWISRIGELLEIKSRTERRDVTQDELAEFVGVSRQTIYTWKSHKGVKSIPAHYTALLCKFFECNEWDLWELASEKVEGKEDSEGQLVGARTVQAP